MSYGNVSHENVGYGNVSYENVSYGYMETGEAGEIRSNYDYLLASGEWRMIGSDGVTENARE